MESSWRGSTLRWKPSRATGRQRRPPCDGLVTLDLYILNRIHNPPYQCLSLPTELQTQGTAILSRVLVGHQTLAGQVFQDGTECW